MPGEILDRPNPEPLPSSLPAVVDELIVKFDRASIDKNYCDAILKFRRAANYIAAGMMLFKVWCNCNALI